MTDTQEELEELRDRVAHEIQRLDEKFAVTEGALCRALNMIAMLNQRLSMLIACDADVGNEQA